jgi:hypothetical protein
MMFRRLTVSLGIVTMAVVVVGCSSSTGGQATPTTSVPTVSSGDKAPSGTGAASSAPKVGQPLDASALVAKPCSSLTASNLADVDLTDALSGPDSDTNGSACSWAGEAGGGINVSWETVNTHGLSDLYAKQSTFAYWQPTTVAGYPGVYADSVKDQRADGDCVLNVGVSDQLTFFVEYDNPTEGTQACSLAGKAASDVIANLKGGA